MIKNAEKQEKILLQLLKKAESTAFGKAHNFSSIKSISDFQLSVPPQTYESHLPYINEAKKGKSNQLWPGFIQNFAVSSGTCGTGKHIPITKDRLKDDRAYQLSVIKKLLSKGDNWSVFGGKVLSMPGSLEVIETDAFSYKIGEISALTADNSLKWIDYFQVYPLKDAILLNWKDKFERLLKRAQESDIRLITGAPTWILEFLKKSKEQSGKEIHQLWPNLKVILSGGVALSHYKQQFDELTDGLNCNYLEMYGASEGYIGISDLNKPDWFNLELNQQIFYEFECLKTNEIVDLSKIVPHKEYAIRLSTNTGLWRYPLKDIVMFNKQFQLKILGRTQAMSDYFGEAVTIDEIRRILKELGIYSKTITIGPLNTDGVNRLGIILTDSNLSNIDVTQKNMDQELIKCNRHYAIRRESLAMEQIALSNCSFMAFQKIILKKSYRAQQKIPIIVQDVAFMNRIYSKIST
jgi:phenylacetate-coenzyme A ligase PaaK-like adenylate-forming protein